MVQNWILLVVLGTLALVWRIHRSLVPSEPLKPGDIVLVVKPGDISYRNNLITEVLSVHGNSISFRGPGNGLSGSTTCGTHRCYIHKLPVDKHPPLRIPGVPVPGGFYGAGDIDTNGATWMEIPQSWFPYTIRKSAWKKSA